MHLQKGEIEFGVPELLTLLDNLSASRSGDSAPPEPILKKCYWHKTEIADYFCKDCKEDICLACTTEQGSPHATHWTILTSDYFKALITQITHLPDWTGILDNNALTIANGLNTYNDFMNELFDDLISDIQVYKHKVWDSIKTQTEKYTSSMKIVNWLYKRYNQEVGVFLNPGAQPGQSGGYNIHQLLFLWNTKIVLPEVNYHYSKTANEVNKWRDSIWRVNLERNFEVKLNQKYTDFKCIQSLDAAHSSDISAMTILKNLKLVTGDYEGNIKIWKMTKQGYTLIQQETPHSKCVLSWTNINQNKFASCSSGEQEIYIWKDVKAKNSPNNDKYIIYQRIQLDKESDFSMQMKFCSFLNTWSDRNTIISYINDNTIKIFMDKKMNCFYNEVDWFDGHNESGINCIIHLKNEKIVTAADDETWRVWEKDRRFETLIGHKGIVNVVVEIDNCGLVSGSGDKTLIIWRQNTEGSYKVRQVLNGHLDSVRTILYWKDERIVSGGVDDYIKIWYKNRIEYECAMTLRGHKGGVSSMVGIDEESFVSGAWDGVIKVWFGVK